LQSGHSLSVFAQKHMGRCECRCHKGVKQLAAAADGGDINDLVVPLLLVLQLERVECRLR
jgi:hypothetical protein